MDATTVVNNRAQIGSGVIGPDGQTAEKKSKTLRAGLRQAYLRRESKDKRQEIKTFDALRAYLRDLYDATELHEIIPRSRSKFALDFPENVFPCPSSDFHKIIQNETTERQIARQFERMRRVLMMLKGKPITADKIMDEWRNLLDEERDAQHFTQ